MQRSKAGSAGGLRLTEGLPMKNKARIVSGLLIASLLCLGPTSGQSAALPRVTKEFYPHSSLEPIQFFGGWRGRPGWRGPWRGPPGWSGRPFWFARPWVRRPYYGTIIAGVALGTLITVAAIGAVPPRPAPNLCWYWADPYGQRGYWDYCY
jgi:hypothetical protein